MLKTIILNKLLILFIIKIRYLKFHERLNYLHNTSNFIRCAYNHQLRSVAQRVCLSQLSNN